LPDKIARQRKWLRAQIYFEQRLKKPLFFNFPGTEIGP